MRKPRIAGSRPRTGPGQPQLGGQGPSATLSHMRPTRADETASGKSKKEPSERYLEI
jgi:hypothetical protein